LHAAGRERRVQNKRLIYRLELSKAANKRNKQEVTITNFAQTKDRVNTYETEFDNLRLSFYTFEQCMIFSSFLIVLPG
jgi:hypothetical protein